MVNRDLHTRHLLTHHQHPCQSWWRLWHQPVFTGWFCGSSWYPGPHSGTLVPCNLFPWDLEAAEKANSVLGPLAQLQGTCTTTVHVCRTCINFHALSGPWIIMVYACCDIWLCYYLYCVLDLKKLHTWYKHVSLTQVLLVWASLSVVQDT